MSHVYTATDRDHSTKYITHAQLHAGLCHCHENPGIKPRLTPDMWRPQCETCTRHARASLGGSTAGVSPTRRPVAGGGGPQRAEPRGGGEGPVLQ